jgi:hypothetical protein
MPIFAEYIWIDGTKPSKQTRSKTRILPYDAVKHSGNPLDPVPLSGFPLWGSDGSSTGQACGKDSDIGLSPVCAVMDPASCWPQLPGAVRSTGPDRRLSPPPTRAQSYGEFSTLEPRKQTLCSGLNRSTHS